MVAKKKAVKLDDELSCLECGKIVPTGRNSQCCSDLCELKYLRAHVARLARKRGPIQCLGQVRWKTCVQEWYLKDSYDAKRRCKQLRKAGWKCVASSIGEIPIEVEGKPTLAKVTILTAWKHPNDRRSYPPPSEFVDGLRVGWKV